VPTMGHARRASIALIVLAVSLTATTAYAQVRTGAPVAAPPPWTFGLTGPTGQAENAPIVQALKARESLRLKPYDDACQKGESPLCGKGNCTVGYGHELQPPHPCTKSDKPISKDEAVTLFTEDLEQRVPKVNGAFHVPLNSFQQTSVFDLEFNYGKALLPNYAVCPIGSLVNAEQFSMAVDSWLTPRCAQQKGKVIPGLVNRRAAEVFDFTYGSEGFPYPKCLPFETAARIGRCGGGRIAFDPSNSDGSFQVWTADVDGNSRVDLGPGDSPVMSPSGAFVAASLGPGRTGAVLYSTTGAPPIDVPSVADDAVQPLAFSPDSHYLAMTVSSSLGSSPSRLEVFDINTGRVDTVTSGDIKGVSFNPSGGGQLVYGYAANGKQTAPDNLYIWTPGDPKPRPITDDGRSANPVWGAQYIAYDHEFEHAVNTPLQEKGAQIWLRPLNEYRQPVGGGRQLTHVPVGELQYGLVPTEFSASGGGLLAEYQEESIPEAFIIDVDNRRASRIRVKGQSSTIIFGEGLAADGKSVLLDVPLGPTAYSDSLVSVPVGGDTPQVLVKLLLDDKASWNQ
jgi:GH24 family phage-related lysozyme (muramidase)